MIRFEKLFVTDENHADMGQLLALSKNWAEEKTMPAYHTNQAEDFLNRELYVAREGDKILAYALGDISELTEQTSFGKPGEKAFVLDELYVVNSHRHQSLGSKLYHFMEDDVMDKVQVIKVIASSYDYQNLLRFYTDQQDT